MIRFWVIFVESCRKNQLTAEGTERKKRSAWVADFLNRQFPASLSGSVTKACPCARHAEKTRARLFGPCFFRVDHVEALRASCPGRACTCTRTITLQGEPKRAPSSARSCV